MKKIFITPVIEAVDIMPSDSVMATVQILASGDAARSVNYVVDNTVVADPEVWQGVDQWI